MKNKELKKLNQIFGGKKSKGFPKQDSFVDKNSEESAPSDYDRREFCRKSMMGLMGGLLVSIPWANELTGKPLSHLDNSLSAPPNIDFKLNKTGDGIIGPFGEARIYNVGGFAMPMIVTSADGSAVMDLTGRSPFIRLGASTDSSAIVLRSGSIQFGISKPVPWSPDIIKKLISTLAANRQKATGLILLRSALYTSYPIAVKRLKSKMNTAVATKLSAGSRGLGKDSLKCTSTTVTDTVVNTITQTINVVKTAEQQYQECYDKQVRSAGCADAGIFAGACAATICGLKAFVEIVVGVTTIVTTVTEEVVRTVVSCTKPLIGSWPNPWNFYNNLPVAKVSQPALKFGATDLAGAIKFLKDITGFFGPLGKCLIDGKWNVAQLQTPLDFGGGKLVLPYGMRVCITSDCARKLALENTAGELSTAWLAALGALAALSTEFAAFAATFGIVATPAIVAAIAGLPEVVVALAAILLAFVIVLLIWGTVISGQMSYQVCCTSNLADGTVCIEHPTFAIQVITLLTLGQVPVGLIPPIVTG